MGAIRHVALVGVLTALSACSGEPADSTPSPPPDAATEAAWKQQGAALIVPFKIDLQAALRGALAEGIPAAIRVCQTEAPAIAAALSKDGVRMGRTAHRLRNPGNAPPPWAETLLADYAAAGDRLEASVVTLEGGRVGYVEPITVQPACLPCHGGKVDEAVASQLAELYPRDQATGFAAGDFRGLFWAEFPAPGTP